MELVERVCSRVAVIVAGQVLAEGTIDEVRGELTLEQRFIELAGGLERRGGPRVAAHVLRLRLALLVGALRGDSGHVTRACSASILLVGGDGGGLLGPADAGGMPRPRWRWPSRCSAGAAVTLGFALAPLIGGVDDPLDPRRFAVLGLARGRLAAVLAVAGFISVPIAVLIAVGVCTAIVWSAHGVAWIAGGVGDAPRRRRRASCSRASAWRSRRCSCASAARASCPDSSCSSSSSSSCRSASSSPRWSGAERFRPSCSRPSRALALTPLGAAWAFPGLVALGDGDAGTSLLVAVAHARGPRPALGMARPPAAHDDRAARAPVASAADSAGSASRRERPAGRSPRAASCTGSAIAATSSTSW